MLRRSSGGRPRSRRTNAQFLGRRVPLLAMALQGAWLHTRGCSVTRLTRARVGTSSTSERDLPGPRPGAPPPAPPGTRGAGGGVGGGLLRLKPSPHPALSQTYTQQHSHTHIDAHGHTLGDIHTLTQTQSHTWGQSRTQDIHTYTQTCCYTLRDTHTHPQT